MEYVETMALRAWNECHGTDKCEGTIEQVIADTKRAAKYAYLQWYGANAQLTCMDSIDQAEVKTFTKDGK